MEENFLIERSGGRCELCSSDGVLSVFIVSPKQGNEPSEAAYICANCSDQLEGREEVNPDHWRCLNDSMWSDIPAVKVIAYRMLEELRPEGWPADLLDILYLDDETLSWAKYEQENSIAEPKHVDSNGAVLLNGDTVVLIKDLDVKGANFIAKRGTPVRNIRLVRDNEEQIEGKVNGQSIVILTQYVKK